MRKIPLETISNMRDLGGLQAKTGETIKPNKVFRSATLEHASKDDQAVLEKFGIVTVFDLRTKAERENGPDQVPETITETALDVLADSSLMAGMGAATSDFFKNPGELLKNFTGSDAKDMLTQTYKDIVSVPSAMNSYRTFLTDIAQHDENEAVLFHCTSGKDRTGWGAAVLLTIAGVARDDIFADYLETNTDLLPSYKPLMDQLAAHGLDPNDFLDVLGVREEYLNTAFAEVDKNFGDMNTYFLEGLGVSEETLTKVKAHLIG